MAAPAGLTTPGYLHRGLDELFRLAREEPLTPRCSSFIFVRHGETDGNHARIFQTAEQPLNARGLAQAEAASEVLKGEKIQRIVASTMPRAWVTAEILGDRTHSHPSPRTGFANAGSAILSARPRRTTTGVTIRRTAKRCRSSSSGRAQASSAASTLPIANARYWLHTAAFSTCSHQPLASTSKPSISRTRRRCCSNGPARPGVRAALPTSAPTATTSRKKKGSKPWI